MSNPEGFQLRIQYKKRGRLAYLSHLETVRSIERTIRRAHLPYAVTEGFNPHMKIAFGPALPCGCGGEEEYVDLRLREQLPVPEVLEALQAAGTHDLLCVDAHYIGLWDAAVTVAFPLFDWEAVLGECTLADMRRSMDALLKRGYIEVIRKKKLRQVEFANRLVSPIEYEFLPTFTELPGADGSVKSAEAGKSGEEAEVGDVVLRFTTRNQDSGALRPDRFLQAALQLWPADAATPAPKLKRCTRLHTRPE